MSSTSSPFVRLSNEVERLELPQQTDKFIKELRQAILEGKVEASYAGETFELPKVFRHRKKTVDSGKTHSPETKRRVAEMVIRNTGSYQQWFGEVQQALLQLELRPRRRTDINPSAEALMGDEALFKQGVSETLRRLKKKRETGKRLSSKDGFQSQAGPKALPSPNPKRAGRRTSAVKEQADEEHQ